ncbi:MAG: hypothetical protein WA751_03190 [Candidatus Dormiibacterota bacterium]
MRTTIDIPEELHRAVRSLAQDKGQSLSQTISDFLREGLSPSSGTVGVSIDPITGFPSVHLGRPITTEMVRAAADDQ